MAKLVIDETKVVLFFLDLAERWHKAAHAPASPEMRHLLTPFEECRAETCTTAREWFVLLDGYQDARKADRSE